MAHPSWWTALLSWPPVPTLLNQGAAQLNGGLGQLTGGLDTLTSNNDALKAGARQVADGVLNSANSTLMEGGLIDQPMTWENYASVIDHVLEMGAYPGGWGAKRWCAPSGSRPPTSSPASWISALYLAATKTSHGLPGGAAADAELRPLHALRPGVHDHRPRRPADHP